MADSDLVLVADSRRKQILLRIKARLERISTANSFRTNAGACVKLNEELSFGEGDPTIGIAIVVGLEQTSMKGEHVVVRLPINVQAIVLEANLDAPWNVVEDVIADIKQAIELEDRTLGKLVRAEIERGPTQTLERQPGSSYTGAEILYTALYPELWGRPAA